MELQKVKAIVKTENKISLELILGIVLAFIVIGHFFSLFYELPLFEMVLSISIISFIILALPVLRGSLRIMTYTLLTIAIVLLLFVGVPLNGWLEAVRLNLSLVTIICFVPLLGIPIRNGDYLEALQIVFFKLSKNIPALFLGTQLFTHMIGIVLNVGTISIMHFLTKATNITSKKILMIAINRGFVTALFWSPYFSAMALILSHIPVSWGSIVFYLIGFGLLSMFVSFIEIWPAVKQEMKHVDQVKVPFSMDEKEAMRKVRECFTILFLMVLSVLVIERFTDLEMVLTICLVSVLFPLLWSLLFRKRAIFNNEVKNHISYNLPKMKNEVVLFFVAGFFSAAFVETNVSNLLIQVINSYFSNFPIVISMFITVVIILSAVIGLHPIIPVTIFATSFDPISLGLSVEYFAVLLLTSWGISNIISPASAINNLIAGHWNTDVTKVSYKWNYKFTIIMAILLPFYLLLVQI